MYMIAAGGVAISAWVEGLAKGAGPFVRVPAF